MLERSVKTAFEPELAKKKLTCMVTGESAIISGDQKRLHQVIFNLVSNAVKYSTESGQILIDIHNLGKNVQLTVKDQGIGIAKEDIPLIFERFYRTDRSRNRKTGGAGIGLTIVKAIVLAHGGNISVESVKGCGSCFTVVLPKKLNPTFIYSGTDVPHSDTLRRNVPLHAHDECSAHPGYSLIFLLHMLLFVWRSCRPFYSCRCSKSRRKSFTLLPAALIYNLMTLFS